MPSPPILSIRNTDQNKHRLYRAFCRWKVILECTGILFAVGYALIAYLQWRDYRANFESTQRPYLRVGKLQAHLDEPQRWISISLENYGHMAATDMYREYHAILQRASDGQVHEYGSCHAEPTMLTPDDHWNTDNLYLYWPTTYIEGVFEGKYFLYIVGALRYRIGFGGKTDIYRLCLRYNPPTLIGTEDEALQWTNCATSIQEMIDAAKQGKKFPLPDPNTMPLPERALTLHTVRLSKTAPEEDMLLP